MPHRGLSFGIFVEPLSVVYQIQPSPIGMAPRTTSSRQSFEFPASGSRHSSVSSGSDRSSHARPTRPISSLSRSRGSQSFAATPLPSSSTTTASPPVHAAPVEPQIMARRPSDTTGPLAPSPLEIPITYTPTTGRISKAKKGKRVHACEHPGCGKVGHVDFTSSLSCPDPPLVTSRSGLRAPR